MEQTIIIAADGSVRFIYDDATMEALSDLGTPDIKRASHVEPTANGEWTADMTPVNGPTLGPYVKRSDALAAEHAYLLNNGIPAVQ